MKNNKHWSNLWKRYYVYLPVVLYGRVSKIIISHSSIILFNVRSVAYSLAAVSATIFTNSSNSLIPRINRLLNVMAGLRAINIPVCALNCSKWRSFIPGSRRACIRGINGLNSSIWSLIMIATACTSAFGKRRKLFKKKYHETWAKLFFTLIMKI